MNQGMPEEPKKSNTGLIIGVVVVGLLCLCIAVVAVGYYLYQNGDQIFGTGALIARFL